MSRLKQVGLNDPKSDRLHSFRHPFASPCANHQVAYRKALAWLGHSSSEILDLYDHLHDADSQAAMRALGGGSSRQPRRHRSCRPPEGDRIVH